MSTLRIPESDRRRLAQIAKMAPAEVDTLERGLVQVQATINYEAFIREVKAKVALEPELVTDAVSFLLSMQFVIAREQITREKIVEDVTQNAIDHKVAEPADGWEPFKKRLFSLLSHGNICISGKAMFLASQTPGSLVKPKILTDARPVYGANASDAPQAFVVSHTFVVECIVDGEEKDLYLSMDHEDLTALRVALDRAIAKEKSMHEILAKTGVPVLSWVE